MPASKSTDKMPLKLKASGWTLRYILDQNITLAAKKPTNTGWYKLSIKAKNTAGEKFLNQHLSIPMYQNDSIQGINLIDEKSKTKELVFLRHKSLTKLQLNLNIKLLPKDAKITITLKKISPLKASIHMLNSVSRQHKAQGESASYIYRITRARQKRAGWHHALTKLIYAYQPALSQQLISCEPYKYWQEHKEPMWSHSLIDHTQLKSYFFTIVIDLKTDINAMRLSIDSVIQQTNTNWQLHICSYQINADALKTYYQPSEKIIYHNEKLLTPKQDSYVLILGAGDVLPSFAIELFSSALELNYPVVYSDHDTLDVDKSRINPHFKPQWNPDFFLNHNYIGPSFIIHSKLLQKIVLTEQWWLKNSYILLIKSMLESEQALSEIAVKHLPHVLFHQSEQNIVELKATDKKIISSLIKQLAETEQIQALEVRSFVDSDIFKIEYQITDPKPLISLLIPTRDALDITRNCVESILNKTSYKNYEIIILDNQSVEEETLCWFKEIQQNTKIKVLRYDYPFNYSAINNYGVKSANGSLIGLINNDTEVINPEWLTEMIQHAVRPEIGCVGAKLYYFDDSVQHGGVIMGLWGLAGHSHKNYFKEDIGYINRLVTVQNLTAVTAACLVVRKEVFNQVNGLDEENLVVAFNDVDFCLKVQQAGYRNLWTPYAELYHYESKSRGQEDTPEKKLRERKEIDFMRKKWPNETKQDPNYSPHLTHTKEDFSLNID